MAQPSITVQNAAILVENYFESQSIKDSCSAFIIQLEKNGVNMDKHTLYDIFWAIHILVNSKGKYGFDDIEFHVKKNPIFAEIPTNYCEKEAKDERPKQVGILRQAIRNYSIFDGQIKMVHLTSKL